MSLENAEKLFDDIQDAASYLNNDTIDNDYHMSYVQSWIAVLKNDPNELFRAIKDAEDIIDYVEEKGEIKKEIDEPNLNNDDYELEI